MRLSIQLELLQGDQLPLNYNYPISAWIYKCLHHGNNDFAAWLHEHGYAYEGKRFKLFTFSQLKCSFVIKGDRMKINAPQAYLTLSFLIDEPVEHFVAGCFRNQQCVIGDKVSRVAFAIKSIELLPHPVFTEKMRYRLLSPLCITRSRIHEGGEGYEFLSPDHAEYKKHLIRNLINKHQSVYAITGDEQHFDIESMNLNILSTLKSRLIRIKDHTPEATSLRGWLFDFELTAPVELQRVGYYAGFGEKNAMGLGCV
ncbi:MAG: CRISPR-associated endoribonuclease Cas6, partial [Chitinophagales bacterium]|nr:CRISPR-associated endoribonuclease Cas6 [Chitinophagales bacterium]